MKLDTDALKIIFFLSVFFLVFLGILMLTVWLIPDTVYRKLLLLLVGVSYAVIVIYFLIC